MTGLCEASPYNYGYCLHSILQVAISIYGICLYSIQVAISIYGICLHSIQVAIRALGFEVKKADVLKILRDYDREGSGKMKFQDF